MNNYSFALNIHQFPILLNNQPILEHSHSISCVDNFESHFFSSYLSYKKEIMFDYKLMD